MQPATVPILEILNTSLTSTFPTIISSTSSTQESIENINQNTRFYAPKAKLKKGKNALISALISAFNPPLELEPRTDPIFKC